MLHLRRIGPRGGNTQSCLSLLLGFLMDVSSLSLLFYFQSLCQSLASSVFLGASSLLMIIKL